MNDTSYVIEPNNNLRLLMCPLDIDNFNQLTFNNEESQFNYFDSLPSLEVDKITYQRHDNVIRFPEVADNILQYNYVMYQNTNYGNKWFYAFIDRIEYSNSNMSNVYIKTDVFQTYQFDIEYKDSFIEREHVNNDSIGLHTVPENLETGEYVCNNITKDDTLRSKEIIVMATTIDPSISGEELVGSASGGGKYNGVYSGVKYYTFDPDKQTINNVLKAFEKAGKSDAILSLFMLPRLLLVPDQTIDIDNYMIPDSDRNITPIIFNVPKLSVLNGYAPKNNKLFTYPYCYLYLSNNNGSNAIYHYELFNTDNCAFDILSVPSESGNCVCVPTYYKNVDTNYSELLVAGKFPICGWQTDVYTNWLTQNGVNNGINIASGIFNVGMGSLSGLVSGATGNLSGLLYAGTQIGGGFTQIASTMGNMYEHSLVPPQASGNTNSGNVLFSKNEICFTAYGMSIKQEYAKIIDNYFSMFGYKVNEVKKPNITGRLNWNFVKSIGLNIIGDIPQYAIEEIKNMFNNGITLWHNPNTFLDYSQNNNIV